MTQQPQQQDVKILLKVGYDISGATLIAARAISGAIALAALIACASSESTNTTHWRDVESTRIAVGSNWSNPGPAKGGYYELGAERIARGQTPISRRYEGAASTQHIKQGRIPPVSRETCGDWINLITIWTYDPYRDLTTTLARQSRRFGLNPGQVGFYTGECLKLWGLTRRDISDWVEIMDAY